MNISRSVGGTKRICIWNRDLKTKITVFLYARMLLLVHRSVDSKTLKPFFLKLCYFKSITSKCCISESFALRRLKEVSIDPKLYLALGSSHNSIPQKWYVFRFTYIYAYNMNIQYDMVVKKGKNIIVSH